MSKGKWKKKEEKKEDLRFEFADMETKDILLTINMLSAELLRRDN